MHSLARARAVRMLPSYPARTLLLPLPYPYPQGKRVQFGVDDDGHGLVKRQVTTFLAAGMEDEDPEEDQPVGPSTQCGDLHPEGECLPCAHATTEWASFGFGWAPGRA